MMEARRVRLTGSVTLFGEMRNTNKVLAGTLKEKRIL
jgi:hypothetical protein